MVKRFLLFFIVIFLVACGQTKHHSIKSKPYAFLDSLLRKDDYIIEFVDFEYPKELQDITIRFQKAIAEKKEWFEEFYSKKVKDGEVMPYDENFGITKDEYQKILDMDKTPPKIVVKSTAFLKANRKSDVFSFKTSEKSIKYLESLKIDFGKELVFFLNDTIPFRDEINTPSTTPFGEWHGYSWVKENSNLLPNGNLKFDSLTSKIIEIDFGTIKKNNKTILRLKYSNVIKGEIKAKLDQACYLN